MPSQNEGPIIRPMRFAAQIADGQGGEACGSSARERERERGPEHTYAPSWPRRIRSIRKRGWKPAPRADVRGRGHRRWRIEQLAHTARKRSQERIKSKLCQCMRGRACVKGKK